MNNKHNNTRYEKNVQTQNNHCDNICRLITEDVITYSGNKTGKINRLF